MMHHTTLNKLEIWLLLTKWLAYLHQIREEGGLRNATALFHTLSEGSGRPSGLGHPQVEV